MTFYGVIEFIHIVVCLALIAIVMMQASEGEGLSGAFGGGGSYALFGKRGATGFVAKATSAAAVTFMFTSFLLAYQVRENTARRPTAAPGQSAPLDTAPDTGAPLADQ